MKLDSRMLNPGDEQLLVTMMGLLATVWAIGVAVYEFIYQYWERNHRDRAREMAERIKLGVPVDVEQKKRMQRGLFHYTFVFSVYVLAGILSAFSIGAGTVALVEGSQWWKALALQLFGPALSAQFALFTWEILTSVKQVGGLWLRVR